MGNGAKKIILELIQSLQFMHLGLRGPIEVALPRLLLETVQTRFFLFASLFYLVALLSSLLATMAAPAVFADVTVPTPVTVPRGASSTNTLVLQFRENSATCLVGGGTVTSFLPQWD